MKNLRLKINKINIQNKSAISTFIFLFILSFIFVPQIANSAQTTFTNSLTTTGLTLAAPSIPSNVTATAVSSTQIDLSWSASIANYYAVAGYRIFRDGIFLATTTSITYSDIGLIPETNYDYNVEAFDSLIQLSGQSTTVTATTTATPVATPTPTPANNGGGGGSSGSASIIISNIKIISGTNQAEVSFDTNLQTQANLSWGFTNDFEMGSLQGLAYNYQHSQVITGLTEGLTYQLKITVRGSNGESVSKTTSFTTVIPVSELGPLPNPSDFVAQPGENNISLTWVNPTDPRFNDVRIVRTEGFYPIDQYDGLPLYEGDGESFIDNTAKPGITYYYAIFSRDRVMQYSSGALAQAKIALPGEIATTTIADPFANIPQAKNVDPRIRALTLADFEFVQDGKNLATVGETVAINGDKNLTIRLKYEKVPEILKTVAFTLKDPNDSSRVFPFLLRINSDKTYYEATIGALGKSGRYGMSVTILDYENNGLMRLDGTLAALAFAPIINLSNSFDFFGLLVLLLIIILIILAIILVRKWLYYSPENSREYPNNQKKALALVLILIITNVIIFSSFFGINKVFAAFNSQINYQGKLTNSSNSIVADGNYNIRFKLYTSLSGGAPIWTETWCNTSDCAGTGVGADNRIPLVSGLFSTMLGSTTSLAGVDFNQPLYLGVEIGGSGAVASWDGEMSPRKILGAVPAAFVAQSANTLSGLDSTEFFRTDAQNATSSASTFLNIVQTGAGKIAEFFGSASQTVLAILSNGNVGIGTTTPSQNLSVQGNALISGNLTVANVTATGTASLANLLLSGSTTLQNFTALNATTTNATSTSFFSNILNGSTSTLSYLTVGQIMAGNLIATSTATSSFTGGLYASLIGAPYFNATSTATSTFAGGLNVLAINQTGSASSTFANGINLAVGCFAISGNCIGSGTVNSGTTGQFAFYGANGTAVSATSSLFVSTASNIGVGTTSPWAQLSINPNGISGPSFVIGSSTGTSFIVTNGGNVGIGTTSPSAKLSVAGDILANKITGSYFIATSTIASQLPYASSTAITLGGLTLTGSKTNNSFFVGEGAGGVGGTSATYSNFIGFSAGSDTSAVTQSNFIGLWAGQFATNVSNSNFIGTGAGQYMANGGSSNVMGYFAGYVATNANYSNFFGDNAGAYATNASSSIFMGEFTGGFASNASHSIFLGKKAGYLDSVNNSSSGTSILIGEFTGTGGFSDSIAIGHGAQNSAARQLNLGNVLFATNIYNSDTTSPTPVSSGNVGVGTTTPWAQLSVNPNGISGPSFVIGSSTATNFIVTNVGNVGIGTTSPRASLHIDSPSSATSDFIVTHNGVDRIVVNSTVPNSTTSGGIVITPPTATAGTANAFYVGTAGANGPDPYYLGKFNLTAGMTGSKVTVALEGDNASATSGRDLSTFKAAYGVAGDSVGTGTGINVGSFGYANGSSIQIGMLGEAGHSNTSGAWVWGGTFWARNNGGGGVRNYGVLASLTHPPSAFDTYTTNFTQSAYYADVDTLTANIFTGRAAGSEVFNIKSNGVTGIGTTSPWANLSVNGTSTQTVFPLFVVASSTPSFATSTAFIVDANGKVGIGTTSPSQQLSVVGNGYFTGNVSADNLSTTNSGATSTFAGGLNVLAINQTGSASSTFANGINLAAGCFSVNGNCLVSGSGTVNSGTTGQFAFYGANGTAVSATSSLFVSTASNIGVGTTSPWAQLSVNSDSISGPSFVIGSSTGTSFIVTNGGKVGVGNSAPTQALDVTGNVKASNSYMISNSSWTGTNLTMAYSGGAATVTNNGSAAGTILRLSTSVLANDAASGVVITTGGIDRLNVIGTGNVGIGTTSPWANLSVNGTSTQTVLPLFAVASSTGTATSTAFIINSNGKVGIGTTSPSQQLSVAGEGYFTGDVHSYGKMSVLGTGGNTANVDIYGATSGTNTGILFNPGLGAVSLVGLGTEGIRVRASGVFVNGFTPLAGTSVFVASAADGNKALYFDVDATGLAKINSLESGSSPKNIVLGNLGGNIGISTTTPWATFSVSGTSTQPTVPLLVVSSTTAATAFIIDPNGKVGIGTTSPSQQLSIAGGIFTTASSTMMNGINLVSGCFSVNGNCLVSGSGTVNSGTTGQFAFYGANGTAVSATSSLFVSTASNIGVGTTSPWAQLSINPNGISGPSFVIGSSTGTSFIVTNGGNVGIGTTSPSAKLSVAGDILVNKITGSYFIATSTTASQLPYASSTAITLGGLTLTGSSATNSFFVGENAGGAGGTSATQSNFIGFSAGSNTSTVTQSNFIGLGAGQYATNASNANFIGTGAGQYMANGGSSNVMGYFAGYVATNASYSNFFGYEAGGLATNASSSIFMGQSSGYQASNASHSIFLGKKAGYLDSVNNSSSGTSILIGEFTGTGGFSDSIAIGHGAQNSAARQLNLGNVLFATNIYNSDTTSPTPVSSGNVGVGTTTPWAQLSVNPNGISGPSFVIGSSTATNFIVTNVGNVGIGTTSPSAKLSVAGDILVNKITGSYFIATSTTASVFPYASTTALTVSGTDGLTLGTLNGPLQAINGKVSASSTLSIVYGGTGISTIPSYGQLLVGDGSGNYSLAATSSLGILASSAIGLGSVGQIPYYSTAAQAVTATSSIFISTRSFVGIGTTTPNSALSVFSTASPQFQLAYDKDNYLTTGVSSSGGITMGVNGSLGGFAITNPQPTAVVSGTGTAAPLSFSVTGAIGGNSLDTNIGVGGIGGGIQLNAGTGGTALLSTFSETGGAGGAVSLTGGTGGAAASPAVAFMSRLAGAGGALTLAGGNGGAASNGGASSANVAGAGGAFILNGGVGGNASGATTNNGGDGGSLYITGGAGGTGSSANGNAGNVYLGYNSSSVLGNVYFGNQSVSYISSTGNFGIGTTSPYAKLSVVGEVVAPYYTATSSTATSTFAGGMNVAGIAGLTVLQNGNVGIGTATPTQKLTVAGGQVLVGPADSANSFINFYNTSYKIGAQSGLELTTAPADIIRFVDGSTENMRIDGSGNVGIATTTPWGLLSVNPNVISGPSFVIGSSTGTSFIVTNGGNVGIGTTNPTVMGFEIFKSGGTNTGLRLGNSNGAAQLTVDLSGNTKLRNESSAKSIIFELNSEVARFTSNGLGIGTTTPWAQLSINSSGVSGPSFVVGSSTATNFIITNVGNVGIGTTSPWANLSVNGTSTQTVLPLFAVASSTGTATSTAFIINSNGKIGIGTSSPSQQLSVAGSGYFTGGLGVGITNTTAGTLRVVDDTLIGEASTTGWSKLGVAGRYTDTTYGAAGNTDQGIAIVNTGNGVTNAPIGITFGTEFGAAGVWGFGGIYGLLTGGANNTVGDVVIANRNVGTDNNFTPNLIVKSGGNVGIGTTSPTSKFEISAGGVQLNTTPAIAVTGLTLATNNILGVRSGATNLGWTIQSAGGGQDIFNIVNPGSTATVLAISTGAGSSPSYLMPQSSASHFGVGTTTPIVRLSVSNTSNAVSGSFSGLLNSASVGLGSSASGPFIQGYANYLNSTSNLNLQPFGGNVGIGTTSPWANLSVNGTSTQTVFPLFAVASSTGTATSTAFIIDPNGNVGIGTTSPSQQLSVAGSGYFTGDSIADHFSSTNSSATSTFVGGASIAGGDFTLGATTRLGFGSSGVSSADIYFQREAAGTLTMSNGNNPQTLRIYNKVTGSPVSPTAFERFNFGWYNNEFGMGTQFGGSGSVRGVNLGSASYLVLQAGTNQDLFFNSNGVGRWKINSSGNFIPYDYNTGKIGIGTTSPWANLSVNGTSTQTVLPLFAVASSTGTATSTAFIIDPNGKVGIGTTSPSQQLSVAGSGYFMGNLSADNLSATNPSATSTFSGGLVVNGAGGRVRIGNNTGSFFENLSIQDSYNAAFKLLDGGGRSLVLSSNRNTYDSISTTVSFIGIQDSRDLLLRSNQAGYSQIVLKTGGTGGNVYVASGMLGISTTTPYAKLSVVGTDTASTTLAIRPVSFQTGNIIDIYSTTGVLSSVVDSAGNFGIGTTTPTQKLDLVGNFRVGDGATTNNGLMFLGSDPQISLITGFRKSIFGSASLTSSSASAVIIDGGGTRISTRSTGIIGWTNSSSDASATLDTGIGRNAAGVLEINTGTSGVLSTLVSKNIGVSSTSPWANLSVNGTSTQTVFPLFAVASSTGTATSTTFIIDPNGKIGIGTTSPSQQLSVAGNGYFTGNVAPSYISTNSTTATSTFAGFIDVLGTGSNSTSTIASNLWVKGTLRANLSYVGDLAFANEFRFTEATPINETTTQALYLNNQKGNRILGIDENGNMNITGDICSKNVACVNESLSKLSSDVGALASSTAILQSGLTTASSVQSLADAIVALDLKVDAFIASSTLDIDSIIASTTVAIASNTDFVSKISSSTANVLVADNSFVNAMANVVKNILSNTQDWVMDKFTAKVAYLNRVEAETVAISKGMEIIDQVNGSVWCVTIKNGDWNKVQGSCASVASTTNQVIVNPTPIPTPANTPIVIVTPEATTSPVVIPDSGSASTTENTIATSSDSVTNNNPTETTASTTPSSSPVVEQPTPTATPVIEPTPVATPAVVPVENPTPEPASSVVPEPVTP